MYPLTTDDIGKLAKQMMSFVSRIKLPAQAKWIVTFPNLSIYCYQSSFDV